MWSLLLTLVAASEPAEAVAPTPPVPAAAPSPPAAAPALVEPAPRVLVLVPRGDSVSSDVRRAIASTLTIELTRTGALAALSSAELSQLAELEADKQEAGCDTSSCLGEIASALGARYVVFGDATQLGGLLVVTLSLFDVDTATSVRRSSFEVKDQADIPAQARLAANALAGGALADRGAVAAATPAAPSSSSLLVPVALMAAGGVVLLGGLGFDLLSPTSNNRALDAGDLVGPTAMVGGAVALVVGGALLGAP